MKKRDVIIVTIGVILVHIIIWDVKLILKRQLVLGIKRIYGFLEAKGVFNR